MRLESTILITGLLLFTYQNCSQSASGTWEQESVDQSSAAVSGTITFGDTKVQEIKFYTDVPGQFSKNGKTFFIKEKRQFILDMHNAVISEQTMQGENIAHYCLTEDLAQEIHDIMNTSSVCKNDNSVNEGTLCAAVITPPYAEIVTDSARLALGYATNSCGKNSVDLCGHQPNILKSWFQNIKAQLGNLPCN